MSRVSEGGNKIGPLPFRRLLRCHLRALENKRKVGEATGVRAPAVSPIERSADDENSGRKLREFPKQRTPLYPRDVVIVLLHFLRLERHNPPQAETPHELLLLCN